METRSDSAYISHDPEAELGSRPSSTYSEMEERGRSMGSKKVSVMSTGATSAISTGVESDVTETAKKLRPAAAARGGALWPAAIAVAVVMSIGVVATVVAVKVSEDDKRGPAPDPIYIEREGPYLLPDYIGTGEGGVVTDETAIAAQVPLKVGTIIPDSGEVRDRQAITVVFNKAVIALGSDWTTDSIDVDGVTPATLVCNNQRRTVEGRWRWATTSMLRFDPADPWPTSLSCEFHVNRALAAWDGAKVDASDAAVLSRTYNTPQPDLRIQDVASAKAKEVTGDLWNAHTAVDRPEVPPDAHMHVVLGGVAIADTDIDSLVAKMTTRPGGYSFRRIAGEQCSAYAGTCVVVALDGALTVGQEYDLVLPRGAQVTEEAGVLTGDLTAAFSGLVPFSIHFWDYELQPGHRNYHMWLRHGLGAGTTLEALKARITVSPAINFDVSLDGKAKLVLHSDELMPNTDYRISVSGNDAVRDGFDLPLLSSKVAFTTMRAPTYIASLHADALHTSVDNGYKVFASDYNADKDWCEGQRLSMRAVGAGDIAAVLDSLNGRTPWQDSDGRPVAQVEVKAGIPARVETFDLRELFGAADMMLQTHTRGLGEEGRETTRCRSYSNSVVLSRTDVGLTVVFGNDRIQAWATDLVTGVGVAGARVQVWQRQSWRSDSPPTAMITEAITDADGLVSLEKIPVSHHMDVAIAVIRGESISLVPGLYLTPSHSALTHRAVLHSDRKIYRPGDTVYLKGYFRSYDVETGELSVLRGMHLQIAAQWGDASATADGSKTKTASLLTFQRAQTVDDYGSVHAALVVPHTAEFGEKRLRLEIVPVSHHSYNETIGVEAITIADPRIPAAVMDFTTDAKTMKPSAKTVPLNVRTATYTGSPVPNSEVECTWEYTAPVTEGTTEAPVVHKGTFSITTDASGTAAYTFTLPPVAAPAEGASVVLTAKWLSPARDILTDDIRVAVRESLWAMTARQKEVGHAIPGIAFDTEISVDTSLDTRDGAGVGASVTVEAFILPDSKATPWPWMPVRVGSEDVEGKSPVATCTAALGVRTDADAGAVGVVGACGFALPTMGIHGIRATLTDADGVVLTSFTSAGRTAGEWQTDPLRLPPRVGLALPVTHHTPGEALQVTVNNPYTSARVWVSVYDLGGVASVVEAVSAGDAEIAVNIDPARCRRNCRVKIIAVTPRDAHSAYAGLVEGFPVSAIADLSQGTLAVADYHVVTKLPDTSITADVRLPATVLPGATVTADVTLVDAAGTPITGEVAVMVVDKAILAIAPHPVPDVASRVAAVDVAGPLLTAHDTREGVLQREVAAMYDMAQQRVDRDPWLSPEGALNPRALEAHVSMDTLLKQHYTDLTPFPPEPVPWLNRGAGDNIMVDGDIMMARAGAEDGDEAIAESAKMPLPSPPAAGHGGAPAPTVRTVFSASPVFLSSVSVVNGRASVELPLSENVGTWTVKVLAVAAGHRFASVTREMVARRTVSTVASLPRVVRYRDEFTAGVVLTAVEDKDVMVALSHDGSALALQGTALHQVSLAKHTPLEVLFSFTATSYNRSESLTFVVTDKATQQVEDGLVAALPVLAPQDPAYLGTSFEVEAPESGAARTWSEGITFPAAVPNSGHVDISASVGRLVAVEAIGTALRNSVDLHSEWLSGMNVLEACAGLVLLKPYLSSDEFAEAIRAPADGPLGSDVKSLARATFHEAKPMLESFTKPGYGFVYSPGSTYYYTDVRLNALAVELLKDVVPYDLVREWEVAMLEGLAREVTTARQGKYEWNNWGALARVYLVMGTRVRFGDDAHVNSVLTMSNLIKHRSKMWAGDRAILLKLLVRERAEYDWEVAELTQAFFNNVRVTGRTAYVAYDSSGHALNDATQADLLTSFEQLPDIADASLTGKLANFVAQGSGVRGGWWMSGGEGSIRRMMALGEYDRLKRSNTADVTITVDAGWSASNTLMEERFTGDAGLRMVAAKTFTYEQLRDPAATLPNATTAPAPLKFSAAGRGEVSVALGLSFAPAEVVTKPKYFGLFVQKAIRVLSGKGSSRVVGDGGVVTLVPGDIVQVSVQVTTADDVAAATISDNLPGGLEAIDQNLPDTRPPVEHMGGAAAPVAVSGAREGGPEVSSNVIAAPMSYRPWWWFGFNDLTFTKDRVTCRAAWLPAGTHTCTYLANVVTSGTFVLPPTKAFLGAQPEVMGWSAGGTLTVLPR